MRTRPVGNNPSVSQPATPLQVSHKFAYTCEVMIRRPRSTVVLTDDDRATLLSWARSRTCSRALTQRAQIVLACAQEPTTTAVAEQLGVSRHMVGKWRSRFLAEGLNGLHERPRPGRPSAVNEDAIAQVLLRLLTPPPSNRREWSTRSMASETGLSQKTVNRLWRTYQLQAPAGQPQLRPDGHSALPSSEVRDVVGLFLDPPTRVLAVIADDRATPLRRRKTTSPTPAPPTNARRNEARNLLAVANAFALVRNQANAHDLPGPGTSLRALLQDLDHRVPPDLEVHLLVSGEPNASAGDAIEAWARRHPRFHQHLVPADSSWLDQVERLLASNPLLGHENAHGFVASLARLRDDLHAWCSTWTQHTPPLVWTKNPWVPRREDHWSLNKDSDVPDHARMRPTTPGVHDSSDGASDTARGRPDITDRVAQLVREALITGQFQHGERVKEAPLATRLGLSRGPVREALRVLAEEGMLERLPKRGAAVPHVDATTILDLYAARTALGTLLMRQAATLRRSELRSINTALSEVRAVARHSRSDHERIGEADLRFQDAIAHTANLPQVSLFFQRLTMRLRTFLTVLQVDFADAAADLIAREDTGIFEAIRTGDGDEAARRWRIKVERSVRYMVSHLPQEHFDPTLWATIAGKPTARPDDPHKAPTSTAPQHNTGTKGTA